MRRYWVTPRRSPASERLCEIALPAARTLKSLSWPNGPPLDSFCCNYSEKQQTPRIKLEGYARDIIVSDGQLRAVCSSSPVKSREPYASPNSGVGP